MFLFDIQNYCSIFVEVCEQLYKGIFCVTY